jgi:dihydroorotate dehydrogenase
MYHLVRPLLFRLDAETAHHLALQAARLLAQLPSKRPESPGSLRQTVFGLPFENPIGIAAGLDKNAQCVPYWQRIGCGYVEVGSVSADPAPGNPKPRAFRLPRDRALINRMGLNNDGASVISERLSRGKASREVPLGVNIVKTHRPGLEGDAAIDDFRTSFRIMAPVADYIALNVSCPNTDDGKTFEDPKALNALLDAIFEERSTDGTQVPVLVKLSPPEAAELEPRGRFAELLAVAEAYPVAGYIATNTSTGRSGLTTDAATLASIGSGGLSGRPLAEQSKTLLKFLYRELSGAKPIISVGGIDSPDEAAERVYLGASLIQVYTGLVYEGPRLIRRLVDGLAQRFEADGLGTLEEAVGRRA